MALTKQKHKIAMTIPKGKAEIKVMVCKAFKPPVRNSNNDKMHSKAPQNTFCQRGVLGLFFVEMLFITKIPESHEVTKNTAIIAIPNPQSNSDKGNCSKNLNSSTSGLFAIAHKAPFTKF